jgi:thioredoxin-like negative regulator of GroEL
MSQIIDSYGLRFLTNHLGRADKYASLSKLIYDPHWYRLQLQFDPSRRSLAHDIEIAIRSCEQKGIKNLPDLIHFSLFYSFLGSVSVNYPPDSLALMVALGEGQQAEGIAQLITEPVQKSEAFARIAGSYRFLKQPLLARNVLESAKKTILSMPDGDLRDRALVSIINAFGEIGDQENCLSLLSLIRNQTIHQQVLGQTASRLCQIISFQAGLQILKMVTSIPVAIITWVEIIDNAKGSGQPSIVLQGKEALNTLIPTFSADVVNVEITASVVRALVQYGEVDRARQIREKFLDAHWYIRGLRWLIVAGKASLALQLLRELGKEVEKAETTDVVKVLAANGLFEEAIQTINISQNNPGKDGAYAAIIWDLALAGETMLVNQLIDRIRAIDIRLWAFAQAGLGYIQRSDITNAHQCLQKLKSEVALISKHAEPKNAYSIAQIWTSLYNPEPPFHTPENNGKLDPFLLQGFETYLDLGDFEKAHLILNFVHNNKTRGDQMLRLINHLASLDHLDWARHFFTKLDPSLQDQARLFIACSYLRQGWYDQAIVEIYSAKRPTIHDEFWREAVRIRIEQSDIAGALDFVVKIKRASVRKQAEIQIAQAFIQAGRVEEALEYADQQTDQEPYLAIYAASVPVLIFRDNMEKALAIWKKCKDGHYYESITVHIAMGWMEKGQYDQLWILLDQLSAEEKKRILIGITQKMILANRMADVQMIMAKMPEDDKKTIDRAITSNLLDQGKFDDAIKRANASNDLRVAFKAIRQKIRQFAAEGNFEEAIQTLRDQVNPSNQSDLIHEIACRQAKKGAYEAALSSLERNLNFKLRSQTRRTVALYAAANSFENKDRLLILIQLSFQHARNQGLEEVYGCFEDVAPLFGILFSPAIIQDSLYQPMIIQQFSESLLQT